MVLHNREIKVQMLWDHFWDYLGPKQWLDSRYPHQHKLYTFLPTLHLSALVLASQSIAWRIYCSWMYGFNHCRTLKRLTVAQPSCYGISHQSTHCFMCARLAIFTQSCNSLYVHEEFTVMSGIQKQGEYHLEVSIGSLLLFQLKCILIAASYLYAFNTILGFN